MQIVEIAQIFSRGRLLCRCGFSGVLPEFCPVLDTNILSACCVPKLMDIFIPDGAEALAENLYVHIYCLWPQSSQSFCIFCVAKNYHTLLLASPSSGVQGTCPLPPTRHYCF